MLILFLIIFSPRKLSPILPVTYISSFNLALFLSIIFFENPTVVTEKETLFEFVVSPPDSFKLNFFCS